MLSKLLKNNLLGALLIFSVFVGGASAQDEEQENTNDNEQSAETIWVGRGYDVMDKYASVDSVREALFEIRSSEDGKPVVVAGDETFPVTVDNNSNSTYDEFYGSSLSEYQTSFANNLSIGGRYKLFSASLDVNFEKNESNALAKEFLTIMHFVTTRRYAMPFDTKQMVKTDAREFIDTGDPQEVFNRFGTHYIWQAEVGGRVDYNFTFACTNANKDVSLRVAAKVAYNALVASVSVENETKYRTTLNQIEQNGKIKIVVHGGEESAAAKIRQSQTALVDWAETVTNQPTLNRFTDRSLRPIWDLASTTERKNELKAAFERYAGSREAQESPPKVAVRRTNQLKMVGSNWYGRASEKHSVGIYAPIADTENGSFVAGQIAVKNNNPSKTAETEKNRRQPEATKSPRKNSGAAKPSDKKKPNRF